MAESQKSSPDSEQKGSKKETLTKKKKDKKGKKEIITGTEGRISDEEEYKSAGSKSPQAANILKEDKAELDDLKDDDDTVTEHSSQDEEVDEEQSQS